MKKRIFFIRIALFVLTFLLTYMCYSQIVTRSYIYDPMLAPRAHNVDFQHLKLEISFDPQQGLVYGKVTETFIPLRQKIDSIVLDGINMDVKEILLNNKTAKFRNDSSHIIIYTPALSWNQKGSITITYQATPHSGLYFIGWNDTTGKCRRQIWSQGQGIDNRNWIPMYDEMNDKITTEMVVTFDTTYKVLSNGKMINKKNNKNGTYTWHYKLSHPCAPYLIMLGIGKYDILETKSASGVPMHLWYYPDWKDRVEPTYKLSEKMVDFYENEIGVPYPWSSYSQIPVQDFMYGAMENVTATVFGDFYFCDNRSYLDRPYYGVNAHELAHQWFGDFVTARSDAHHWLQESFATYYDWMFEKKYFGEDQYDWTRRHAQVMSLQASEKDNLPVANSEAGTIRHYPKGGFVLSMLKYVLGGREIYNKCIKHYLESHAYGNVDTKDLLIACEEVTGMQLDWFFEEWLYKGGEPDYKITFRDITENALDKDSKHYAEFLVEQVQPLTNLTGLPQSGGEKVNAVASDPFVKNIDPVTSSPAGLWKMPLWFEVHYTDGSIDKIQRIVQKQTETIRILIPSEKKIDFALFDPNDQVLKSVSFHKSFDELKSQATKSEYMLDRYNAVVAMENTDMDKKRDFLISLYNSNQAKYHAIKAEIIKQLSKDKSIQTITLMASALKDPDVDVRKAVLNNYNVVPKELLPEVETLLKDSSYDIVIKALDYLSFTNPEKVSAYLEQTKDVVGAPGRNVKIKWLEIASLSNDKYKSQLVSYTGTGYEFFTRVNAMHALEKLNYINKNGIENLTDAMINPNIRLARPASDALKYFYNQLRYKQEITNYIESKKWKPWEADILHAVVK